MTQQSPQPPESRPTLPEHLTDALVKLLVAGSGGSTLYFVFTKRFPDALIALTVTTGVSLLTTFGESLLRPLKEWLNQRGEQSGRAVTKVADRAIDYLFKFEEQYLEALKAHCYTLEVEGFKADLPPLALEDVFVPLQIDSDPSHSLGKESFKNIWDLLPKHKTLEGVLKVG